jgi:hypothetical protein
MAETNLTELQQINETVPGGAYLVNGILVNANGLPIKQEKEEKKSPSRSSASSSAGTGKQVPAVNQVDVDKMNREQLLTLPEAAQVTDAVNLPEDQLRAAIKEKMGE